MAVDRKFRVPDEAGVRRSYEEFRDRFLSKSKDASFVRLTERFCTGLWKDYLPILGHFESDFTGKVFLDYGCKYGHLTPLLVHLGAAKIVSLDVNDNYLAIGKDTFGQAYDVEYVKTHNCLIPVAPDSVDFILVNEVISHINPAYLETFYNEAARVLRVGGVIVISDGNNLAHQKTHLDLLKMYDGWENGPESSELGKTCYREMRARIVRATVPTLSPEAIDYVARNTSGMFGEELRQVARDYAATNQMVCRPYRAGVCPTNPNNSTVMERGFYPEGVEHSLEGVGLAPQQMMGPNKPFKEDMNPGIRGQSKTFRIRAVKEVAERDALIVSRQQSMEKKRADWDSVWAKRPAAPAAQIDAVADAPAVAVAQPTQIPEATANLERRETLLVTSVTSLERRRTSLLESIAALDKRQTVLTNSVKQLEQQRQGLLGRDQARSVAPATE